MTNEELQQRGYLRRDGLKGDSFGSFESLNLGGTTLGSLVKAGLPVTLPNKHAFECTSYSPPSKPATLRPDEVILDRRSGEVKVAAVREHKPAGHLSGTSKAATRRQRGAQEQALLSSAALGAPLAVATDGSQTYYIDVLRSIETGDLVPFDESRTFSPAVVEDILAGGSLTAKDPTDLAERVWQLIWHATKAEPKECLLTFVEIFVLKFLSDNLPSSVLPDDLNFYRLVGDSRRFLDQTGMTEVEYYVDQIRPRIKTIFPDNTICDDPEVASLLGMSTIVSKTSIINGFVFLQSGNQTHESYNQTFLEVVDEFNRFGSLTRIDPEFKLRLYETFLRRSARQQRLGQFFTPRNIVRPMVRMAQLDRLPAGSTVLDPAAGVGGFVLEPLMWGDALAGNVEIVAGKPRRQVRTVGLDVDADLHILAKANMLLHLAELVRDPATTPAALNKAMAETFVLMDDDKTLGSLLQPPDQSVDVILTNPPYVTRGSAIYKNRIKGIRGPRNGKILKDYYDGAGLGVEALFLRYISGALRPGGRAFVIVPQGLLNRTEPRPKEQLLSECNLLASIQLPRSAFFNTAQKTYILVLERRHTDADPRPPVMCGLARSIGETLDWRRTPTTENDLADIAECFVALDAGDHEPADSSDVVKMADPSMFGKDDRWDVLRFWTDDELVALGEAPAPVERTAFLEDARTTLDDLLQDMTQAEEELEALAEGPTVTISIGDDSVFDVRSGTRITTKQIQDNPPISPDDSVSVYSCFKESSITKGTVSAQWLAGQTTKRQGIKGQQPKFPLEGNPVVTVNANGASVGKVFVRPEGCLITDDVIAVAVQPGVDINTDYLQVALQSAVTAGGFLYEAKLFTTRLKELSVSVPVDEDGEFDLERQRNIASAIKRFDAIVARLGDLGAWSREARLI